MSDRSNPDAPGRSGSAANRQESALTIAKQAVGYTEPGSRMHRVSAALIDAEARVEALEEQLLALRESYGRAVKA